MGEDLELFADRAVLWPRQGALIITDTHFGKTATFRKAGIPVPEDTTRADLAKLSRLLERTGASRLIILGDLLHAKSGRQPDVMNAVVEWRAHHSTLSIDLMRGNHDRAAGAPPPEWNIELHVNDMVVAPFMFVHEPTIEDRSLYVMSGHIHPSVSLSDGLHRRVRLPCFSFGTTQAILPAFGSFTGTYELKPVASDRIYVAAGDEVVLVPFS
jgi:DNA ligase-associated metallophosphoesterase